jgi:DNA-binding transcriptional MerR regulator
LGFALAEIAELLELEAGDTARCIDVLKRAKSKCNDVQAKLDDLERIRTALDALIEACPGKGPARKCSILDAIKSGELHLNAMTKDEGHGEQIPKN